LGGEMSRVAGDARRRLVVKVGDAIERVPFARSVGMPAISGQELEIHRGPDRPPGGGGDRVRTGSIGLFGFQVRRHVKKLGAELVLGLARVDPDEVGSARQYARREFVGPHARRTLPLRALRVDSPGVFHDLTFFFPVNPQVGRDVAIDKIEREKGKLGDFRLEREGEPIHPRVSLAVGRLRPRRQVRPIVGQPVDGFAQRQRVGRFRLVVRLGLEGDPLGDRAILTELSNPDRDSERFGRKGRGGHRRRRCDGDSKRNVAKLADRPEHVGIAAIQALGQGRIGGGAWIERGHTSFDRQAGFQPAGIVK
jgi:hypothetical protein